MPATPLQVLPLYKDYPSTGATPAQELTLYTDYPLYVSNPCT